MNVIFLDYDGVVNIPTWEEKNDEYVCRFNWPEDDKVNSYQAVQWVSEFCQKHDYKIVVSSTWRRYPNYKECLLNAGLREDIEIIGATPCLNGTRGEEISKYLEEHPDVTGYLIFDDDEDMGKHMDRLVKCDPNHGFMLTEFGLAETLHFAFNNNDCVKAYNHSDIDMRHDIREEC